MKRKRGRESRLRLLKSWLPKKKLKRERTKKYKLLKNQEKQSYALMFWIMLRSIILQLLKTT